MQEQGRRARRLADQIKIEVSDLVSRKIKDPEVGFVTITRVRMSPDLRLASIQISNLGNEMEKEKTLAALKRSVSFLRRELAGRLKTRFVPELRFYFDDTMDYANRISELLQRIHDEENH